MVKKFQRLAGAGLQAKLKMWNVYILLIIGGLIRNIYCTDEKQMEGQTVSTISSNDNLEAQVYSKDSSLEVYNDRNSNLNSLNRYSKAVPRVSTTESSSKSKSKSGRKLDYVLKIPLSVLRQYDLYRILRLQEHTEDEIDQKRHTVIPVPRFGRSESESEDEYDDTKFSYPTSEQDKLSEVYLQDLPVTDVVDKTLPRNRNKRSMVLLTVPKSEDNTKQKPSQTFILPYPRPGRSNMYKTGKTTSDDIVISYYSPDQYREQNNLLKKSPLRRSLLKSVFSKEQDAIDTEGWYTGPKSNSHSIKLDMGTSSDNNVDENEENSFFVIPYPRPGKKSIIKLKNSNSAPKNAEKEVTDYVLPYPRPGKKSEKEKLSKLGSYKSKGTNNVDSPNLIFPYPRPGRASKNLLTIPDIYDLTQIGTNFDIRVPFLETMPSSSHSNEASVSNDIHTDSKGILQTIMNFENLENDFADGLRFKRTTSVVPYPRLGRSDAVVPYPRLGKSSSVIPYPRFGKSTDSFSEVYNEKSGRSNNVAPHPRLGRAESILPYPRPGRAESVVPYPRFGRADSLVPYPRPGRAESIVPYPRPGRAESIVPYPRPGRAESIVPYPRPGRAESIVPYPRPGRSNSLVPYPRPGRGKSIVPYPRPGRSEFLVPYPRPGRSDSLVPHSIFIRSNTEKQILPTKYNKVENWLLPNLRPGRSQLRKDDIYEKESYLIPHIRYENFEDGDNSKNTNIKGHSLNEYNLNNRYGRAAHNQGYVLPHPRIGRSLLQKRMGRESMDTDTVIPYPRLGRSQKETNPKKPLSEIENSVHKLNKHMLPNVEDSVYILPYPRPGRYSE